MVKIGSDKVGRMFGMGARRSLVAGGVPEGDAERMSTTMGKSAARRYDEDDGSFWSDNKSWMIPTLVGLASFMVGDQVGKYGRRDRNAFQNLKDVLFYRIRRGTDTGRDMPIYSLSTAGIPTKDTTGVGTGLL